MLSGGGLTIYCVFPRSYLPMYVFQIRVVNAFRQGVDVSRLAETGNPNLAAVLQKQSSFQQAKRLSQGSSLDYADMCPDPDELKIPEIDVDGLTSRSHTETAV